MYRAEPQADKHQLMYQYYTLISNTVLSITYNILPRVAIGVIYSQLFRKPKILTCLLTNKDAKIGKKRNAAMPQSKSAVLLYH